MRGARRAAFVLVPCLLPLAGCGDAGEGNGAAAREQVARELARVEVRPGLWEVDTEIVQAAQPGLPAELAARLKGRRPSYRHCISSEQAARPDANFLAGGRDANCTYGDFAMRDGRIAGAMRCRDAEGLETAATMSGSYGPDRFDMQMEIETPGLGGGKMSLVARRSGRRIGDCPAEGDAPR